MNDLLLAKYARLLVKIGVNLQQGQTLVIATPIECADITRMIAQIAYEEGAKDVVINWRDEKFNKIRYLHAPEQVFEEFPQWQKELYLANVRQGAAFLTISASDPDLMKDVNPVRIMKAQKTSNTALEEWRERLMSNKNAWCVASVPTKSWAQKVFPDLPETEAVEQLWQAIFKTVRVDADDPVAAWAEHKNNLKKRLDFLNSRDLKFLHFKNELGTDLRIELPQNHLWFGGSDFTPEGVEFIANMPTEEVYTLPKKTGVDGTVVSSLPLNYNGTLIENFTLTFEAGRVVDFTAAKGYEALKSILEIDEGSSYLGEVALVPYDSPISNSKTLFYNTLFDENASCHLALGKAYPVCIKAGENMSKAELDELGVNDSLAHEDFMIGTADITITGTTSAGETIPVFANGNFVI